MNIHAENIEFLIFEKLEGNLTPQEVAELDTFINLNPQYRELMEDWSATNIAGEMNIEEFDLTNILISNVSRVNGNYYWLLGSLSTSLLLLIGSLFIITSKPKSEVSVPVVSIQPVPEVQVVSSVQVASISKSENAMPLMHLDAKADPFTGLALDTTQSSLTSFPELSSTVLAPSLSQDSLLCDPIVVTDSIPAQEELSTVRTTTIKTTQTRKSKYRFKRMKLGRDAQFQEVNSNF